MHTRTHGLACALCAFAITFASSAAAQSARPRAPAEFSATHAIASAFSNVIIDVTDKPPPPAPPPPPRQPALPPNLQLQLAPACEHCSVRRDDLVSRPARRPGHR